MRRNLTIIAIFSLLILTIILFGNIITIGEKLGEVTHVYIEYLFYLLILALLTIYIIRPIIKVHYAPVFPVLAADENANPAQLQTFAKRLARNCGYIIDPDKRKQHQQQLLQQVQAGANDAETLKQLITDEIALRMDGSKELDVLGINNRIKEWGKTVFMITALSQNSKFDTITVLVMNYRLISDIVLATGFRPTHSQMFKLYVRVLTTALITYCASQVLTDVDGVAPFDWDDGDSLDETTSMAGDIDIEEGGFGSSIMENLKKLTIPGVLVGSAIDGCINALMTLRIGYVTRAYLTEGPNALSGISNKRRIKRQAIKESFKAMPAVIAHGSASIGKTTAKVLKSFFSGE